MLFPFDEFEVDASNNDIHFPFVSDHHLKHNQAKNSVSDILDYPDDSFINAKRWVAKMYGHALLPSVKTYSSTFKYAPFKLLTDFEDIVIKACAWERNRVQYNTYDLRMKMLAAFVGQLEIYNGYVDS